MDDKDLEKWRRLAKAAEALDAALAKLDEVDDARVIAQIDPQWGDLIDALDAVEGMR